MSGDAATWDVITSVRIHVAGDAAVVAELATQIGDHFWPEAITSPPDGLSDAGVAAWRQSQWGADALVQDFPPTHDPGRLEIAFHAAGQIPPTLARVLSEHYPELVVSACLLIQATRDGETAPVFPLIEDVTYLAGVNIASGFAFFETISAPLGDEIYGQWAETIAGTLAQCGAEDLAGRVMGNPVGIGDDGEVVF